MADRCNLFSRLGPPLFERTFVGRWEGNSFFKDRKTNAGGVDDMHVVSFDCRGVVFRRGSWAFVIFFSSGARSSDTDWSEENGLNVPPVGLVVRWVVEQCLPRSFGV